MRILVTGADGFVGRVLCARLIELGFDLRPAVRRRPPTAVDGAVELGDICTTPDWARLLSGCDAVVHLAAVVHEAGMRDPESREHCFAVNIAATERLAYEARAAGVRRFVFLSTAKVLGDSSGSRPLTEADAAAPEGTYAESKWRAERALAGVAASGGLEVVVLRPPLVYGPGVKANFERLIRWINRGWPLPFASVRNRRSLLYVGNLVSAIVACLEHPAAAGETFLVDDGEPTSTPALIRSVAQALGRVPRLVPCPVPLLRAMFVGIGQREIFDRLCGNLEVSSGKIHAKLTWTPAWSRETGIRAAVAGFRARSPTRVE